MLLAKQTRLPGAGDGAHQEVGGALGTEEGCMPTARNPGRGGVAAATAFYGNRAGGAASAGIKHAQRGQQHTTDMLTKPRRPDAAGGTPGAARGSDISAANLGFDASLKSPRAVMQWERKKLEMAGMATVVEKWDDSKRPWERPDLPRREHRRTVTTPAPTGTHAQSSQFTKMNPLELQKFEQWHDRHPRLLYPVEIPDAMFYRKRPKGGKGPIPSRDNKGEKVARAYGGKHVKKLPAIRRATGVASPSAFDLDVASERNARGRIAFLNTLLQDVGSGDGSWLYPNPRVLRWLPYELLRAEQYFHLTETLTNLHFLLRKIQECGAAAVRHDLQQADKAFASLFRSGRCQQQAVSMESLLDWQARIKSYKNFVAAHVRQLAALPVTIFQLGNETQSGGHVHSDVQSAVLQAEHSISVVHTLLDPLQSSDADAVNNIPRLLAARKFLEVVRNHGIWLAMDSTTLDRITSAERRADQHLQDFRDRLQQVPESIDRVGQVLLRGPLGQSEHWEKDEAFAYLADLFGENFFSYEPQQAFAAFSVQEASAELDESERNRLLLDLLAEETGLSTDCLELTVNGREAALMITTPANVNGSPRAGGANENGSEFAHPPAREIAHRVMSEACNFESDLRQSGLLTGGPAPPTFWQEACIFITSTIADMQPERDMLSRFVLPALKREFRRRRLRLSWIMCGVDAPADLHKNLTWVKKSNILLPNGKRSQFSLAVLGSKIGWVPGKDIRVETARLDPEFAWVVQPPFVNWSLNQLEIFQAQLRAEDSRGFLFLRDPNFIYSEAFKLAPLQVQEIFLENSQEAKDLDDEFKTYISNQNRITKQTDGRIFEYKTVFVDGQVQNGSGPGVRVSFSGLFSFGLDVYCSLFKMLDSAHPTCLSSQPELRNINVESDMAREEQLQLHAVSLVDGTRTLFLSQLCELVFYSEDDILVAVDGPTGCGRTCIMANVCLRIREEQARRARMVKAHPVSRGEGDESPFVFAWVLHEPWQTTFDWQHALASQLCRRPADAADEDEFVGDVSMESIVHDIWDMMTRGISVYIAADGLSEEEQMDIGRLFNTLQERSNNQWFGDPTRATKMSLGRLKVVVSTHGFRSEMHRRVQIVQVPDLDLEERLRIVHAYTLETKSQIPTPVFERMCAVKSHAAYPRYLKVAMTFMSACQLVFPGQVLTVAKSLSPHLSTLYENDLLPFLEDLGDAEGVRDTLAALVNSKGILPFELRWVLHSDGQPGDDGRVGALVDRIQPFISAHRRADQLLCLGCKTLQECIARRYNLEVAEIPLHRSKMNTVKKEATAQSRLVHRRLVAEMEARAGFKPKDSQANDNGGNDAAEARDVIASQVMEKAIWNAQQDCLTDLMVSNAREVTIDISRRSTPFLERSSNSARGKSRPSSR